VRFLVDANLAPRLAVSLTCAGHDAVHVSDLGMNRSTEILDAADRRTVSSSQPTATAAPGSRSVTDVGRRSY
jgi:hypothetical protein